VINLQPGLVQTISTVQLSNFFRNDALDARNYFSPERAEFKQNQPGGTIGGPLKRGRIFFFGDYQGTRQLIGRVVTSTVPTNAQRQGNFSSSLGALLFIAPDGSATTTATGKTLQSMSSIQMATRSGELE
jgi:hypothetical protein